MQRRRELPAKRQRVPPANFYDTERYRWASHGNRDFDSEILAEDVDLAMKRRELEARIESIEENADLVDLEEEINIMAMERAWGHQEREEEVVGDQVGDAVGLDQSEDDAQGNAGGVRGDEEDQDGGVSSEEEDGEWEVKRGGKGVKRRKRQGRDEK